MVTGSRASIARVATTLISPPRNVARALGAQEWFNIAAARKIPTATFAWVSGRTWRPAEGAEQRREDTAKAFVLTWWSCAWVASSNQAGDDGPRVFSDTRKSRHVLREEGATSQQRVLLQTVCTRPLQEWPFHSRDELSARGKGKVAHERLQALMPPRTSGGNRLFESPKYLVQRR